ncbi:hypothetical protein HZC07_00300 [Candidatus Micrarchaeota archaeon]|nr:hypothetical protein [Candidatus Micrarchaeota archaeon]
MRRKTHGPTVDGVKGADKIADARVVPPPPIPSVPAAPGPIAPPLVPPFPVAPSVSALASSSPLQVPAAPVPSGPGTGPAPVARPSVVARMPAQPTRVSPPLTNAPPPVPISGRVPEAKLREFSVMVPKDDAKVDTVVAGLASIGGRAAPNGDRIPAQRTLRLFDQYRNLKSLSLNREDAIAQAIWDVDRAECLAQLYRLASVMENGWPGILLGQAASVYRAVLSYKDQIQQMSNSICSDPDKLSSLRTILGYASRGVQNVDSVSPLRDDAFEALSYTAALALVTANPDLVIPLNLFLDRGDEGKLISPVSTSARSAAATSTVAARPAARDPTLVLGDSDLSPIDASASPSRAVSDPDGLSAALSKFVATYSDVLSASSLRTAGSRRTTAYVADLVKHALVYGDDWESLPYITAGRLIVSPSKLQQEEYLGTPISDIIDVVFASTSVAALPRPLNLTSPGLSTAVFTVIDHFEHIDNRARNLANQFTINGYPVLAALPLAGAEAFKFNRELMRFAELARMSGKSAVSTEETKKFAQQAVHDVDTAEYIAKWFAAHLTGEIAVQEGILNAGLLPEYLHSHGIQDDDVQALMGIIASTHASAVDPLLTEFRANRNSPAFQRELAALSYTVAMAYVAKRYSDVNPIRISVYGRERDNNPSELLSSIPGPVPVSPVLVPTVDRTPSFMKRVGFVAATVLALVAGGHELDRRARLDPNRPKVTVTQPAIPVRPVPIAVAPSIQIPTPAPVVKPIPVAPAPVATTPVPAQTAEFNARTVILKLGDRDPRVVSEALASLTHAQVEQVKTLATQMAVDKGTPFASSFAKTALENIAKPPTVAPTSASAPAIAPIPISGAVSGPVVGQPPVPVVASPPAPAPVVVPAPISLGSRLSSLVGSDQPSKDAAADYFKNQPRTPDEESALHEFLRAKLNNPQASDRGSALIAMGYVAKTHALAQPDVDSVASTLSDSNLLSAGVRVLRIASESVTLSQSAVLALAPVALANPINGEALTAIYNTAKQGTIPERVINSVVATLPSASPADQVKLLGILTQASKHQQLPESTWWTVGPLTRSTDSTVQSAANVAYAAMRTPRAGTTVTPSAPVPAVEPARTEPAVRKPKTSTTRASAAVAASKVKSFKLSGSKKTIDSGTKAEVQPAAAEKPARRGRGRDSSADVSSDPVF